MNALHARGTRKPARNMDGVTGSWAGQRLCGVGGLGDRRIIMSVAGLSAALQHCDAMEDFIWTTDEHAARDLPT